MSPSRPILPVLLLLLGACDAPSAGRTFSATVRTPEATTARLDSLAGQATFTPGTPGRGIAFELLLVADDGGLSFHSGYLRVPPPGTYPLAGETGDDGALIATYSAFGDGTPRLFVARAGQLVIDDSQPRRLAGSFSFTAADAAGTTVEVAGRFRARAR